MKQVEKSKKIMGLLEKVLGTKEFDPTQYAVFETVAINNLPLNKKGIYDGAVLTEDTIKQMVAALNKENFVPLHTMHRQGMELPIGRVFYGELNSRPGKRGKMIHDMHALFYISLGTDKGRELADALDSGIINEVSVGIYPKTLKCSKCEFDYMKDGDIFNWLDRKCANDHKIGENGVHAILDGLEKFMELSLVSLGAADHARILDKSQSVIAEEDLDQRHSLAASSGVTAMSLLVATKGTEQNMSNLNATEKTALRKDFETRGKRAAAAKFAGITDIITKLDGEITVDEATDLRAKFDAALATFDKDHPEPVEDDKDIKLSLEAFVDLKADLKNANTTIAARDTTITELNAQIATFSTQMADLTTKTAGLSALTAESDLMRDFLKLACQNMVVAAGITKPEIPNSAAELIETIKLAQGKLSKLPVGGLALSAESGTPALAQPAGNSGVFVAKK